MGWFSHRYNALLSHLFLSPYIHRVYVHFLWLGKIVQNYVLPWMNHAAMVYCQTSNIFSHTVLSFLGWLHTGWLGCLNYRGRPKLEPCTWRVCLPNQCAYACIVGPFFIVCLAFSSPMMLGFCMHYVFYQ